MVMQARQPIDKMSFSKLFFAHPGHDPILRHCDFDFPIGGTIWIKSPEGEGKSTLMQIIGGLIFPQTGSYLINNTDVTQFTFEEFLPLRLNIGFTFDYGGLIYNKSIADNLLLPLVFHKLISEKEAHERVEELLKTFEIEKFKNERPAHVPGRVRKLAVLLRGLVTHPQLLLLDDPSVGLTKDMQDKLLLEIKQMRKKGFLKTVVMSSYDLDFMGNVEADIVHLDEGSLYLQKQFDHVVGL
jgi:phospholipid/cholesterol/gamma-HCH transport system ATP-binding protein